MPLDRRLLILDPTKYMDGAVIHNTPIEKEGFPATNVFTDHPSDVWRPGASPATIEFDLGEAKNIDAVFIGHTTISATSSSAWQVWGSNDSGFGSFTYDSGTLPLGIPVDNSIKDFPTRNLLVYDFDGLGAAARYWRITFANFGFPGAGNWVIGRIMVADSVVFTRGIDFGWNLRRIQPVDQARSFGGALYTAAQNDYRRMDLTISYNSQEDAFADFYELDMNFGLTRPLVVCIDAEEEVNRSRRLIYGPFEELTPIENQYLDFFQKRFVIHEMESLR